ncbi:ferritin-like domain-containing protein [Hymenobacter psychrotolerans]|uniref:Ferritin-like domain-containing protein n=1 Tax=Hymenobacter psychrotolerans DSM 18569 TaxID=1121959 RepID=A0A1M6RV25_9BACT|nr:ferritin-like domain-containing protein [Hymenobacter psychrotolerans]SHK36260.1 Ferritin-like domain-containing protein [Hymenobacter psychrotolerans DSM 18569]
MHDNSFLARTLHRRSFFRVAGAGAAASALVLAGCAKDDTPNPGTFTQQLVIATKDSLDNNILNYAYLLEQLEAAFYDKVVATPPADLLPGELAYLTDLRDHELIHREYLKYALGTNVYDNSFVTPLTFDFSSLTLTTRAGVWAAAQLLENIGVAAYNGAGKHLTAPFLKLLGKIASVEARHATLVQELVQPGSWATGIGTTGLDAAKTPLEVVALIQPFIPVPISTDFLPTT